MASQKRGRPLGRPKVKANDVPTDRQILQVATRLFLEKGFQKVSIDDVAKEAGMTKATVYYYFDSKAELFTQAIVALMNRVREKIVILLDADKPLYERLLDVTTSHLQATISIDLESFMRESKTSLSSAHIQAMKTAEESMYAGIEHGFIDAMNLGEIPKINAKFAAHSYIALLTVGNYKQPDGESLFTNVDEAAENILRVFWKGFLG